MPRILVAEDDDAVRSFVGRALRHRGHTVVCVENAFSALEALAENAFDLLITDIVMPGLNGIELALQVSRDHPRVAILLISGYTHTVRGKPGIEAMPSRIMAKPFTLQQICDEVDEVLLPRDTTYH